MDKPRVMFYHDGRHPLIYMYEPPMQKEEYESAVDELVGTPVEAIMFCLGDGRTVLHDTKVGELWGHNMKKWPHLIFRRAHQNAKHLIDGLHLAHWFGNWPYGGTFYEKLRELPYPDVMAPKDKFYYVPTETGRYPEPTTEPGIAMQLPAALSVDRPARITFTISDDLARWRKVKRVHEVLLRVRVMNTTERDRLRFRLNGKELPHELLRKINEMYRMRAPRYRTGSGYWFVYRLDRSHWPKRGRNTVEVALLRRDRHVTPQIYVRDVELEIKYLMGRNFGRGQDLDLGEFEHSGV